jgi:hypothetical protein
MSTLKIFGCLIGIIGLLTTFLVYRGAHWNKSNFIFLGKKITDPSSGLRAFRLEAMASIRLHEDQYHTSALIIETVRKGLQIVEVPITILKRIYGKSKKGKDLMYGLHFARIIIKTWWR